MNYYERHLGDYARDTAHLSIIEHGAYTLLLDRYYATESGIPADQAHRLARARTNEEREAVDTVLREFFALQDGVWTKARVEKEIARTNARIDAAKANGTKGGRPKKKPDQNPMETQEEPSGLLLGYENETQKKALHTPYSIPQGKDQDLFPPAEPAGAETKGGVIEPPKPAERLMAVTREAVAAFNRILGKPNGQLSAVTLVNETRRDQVKRLIPTARAACERLYGAPAITPEFWDQYFGECDKDPFKRGDGPYAGTHANWRPSFEYLTRRDVLTEVFDRAMSEDAA